MEPILSSDQEILAVDSNVSSPAILLERGLHCTQQGYDAEGILYLARAREGLSPDQSHLTATLDALIQSHTRYMQAQQALLLASKRFVEAEAEQQTHQGAVITAIAFQRRRCSTRAVHHLLWTF